MSAEDEVNFTVFRDCVSVAIIERSREIHDVRNVKVAKRGKCGNVTRAKLSQQVQDVSESTPAELSEFVDYLAEEAFPALPTELRDLSYQKKLANKALEEKYATPISSDLVEAITNVLTPSIEDSLVAYRLVSPPSSDLSSFLIPVLNNYVSTITTPPPHPLDTRASACEICERDWITLTYHHLIPRGVHAKVLKRGMHPENMLNNVAWLCRACHSFVHRMASNEELAREYFTVEMILEREDVQKFAAWVGSVRWKKR